MKSTTGVYGDFPDYYYAPGNQFGAYLLGQTAPMSWDTRKELEADGGGYAVVRAPRSSSTARPIERAVPIQEALARYVKHSLEPDEARRVLQALLQVAGRGSAPRVDADPYAMLDRIFERLPANTCETIFHRLDQLTRARRARSRTQKSRKPDPRRPRPRARREGDTASNRALPVPPEPVACALCAVPLKATEIAHWRANQNVFLQSGYCSAHAAKVRSLFEDAAAE